MFPWIMYHWKFSSLSSWRRYHLLHKRTKKCKLPRIALQWEWGIEPQACGIAVNGRRDDFTQNCEPCLDEDFVYFFEKPCSKAPVVCLNDEKCFKIVWVPNVEMTENHPLNKSDQY